jgi:hypothetical protein
VSLMPTIPHRHHGSLPARPASDVTAPTPPERWCRASERPDRTGQDTTRREEPRRRATPYRCVTTRGPKRATSAPNTVRGTRTARDQLPLSVWERWTGPFTWLLREDDVAGGAPDARAGVAGDAVGVAAHVVLDVRTGLPVSRAVGGAAARNLYRL